MLDRNTLPRWINRAIDSVADAPTSIAGRMAARRLGAAAPVGSVPVTTFDDRPTRVLIAPVNYSGQGIAWARALEHADPMVSARNMAIDVPGGFGFEADLVVPVGTYHNDPDWQQRQKEAAFGATHVLIEAEEPPFGRLMGRSVAAQARSLQDAGVSVAFLAHGTDVRLPSRHVERSPWSHYNDPLVYAPRAETLAARNIQLMLDSARPLFVSTPDLMVDIPSAEWCPVVVDPARWATERMPHDGPLRVAHAPSVGPVKGTGLILPLLTRLAAEGVIRLELVQGADSAAMPAVFARSDVVLDQFRIGSYGVVACEAMAAGCVVIGHVPPDVRAFVAATGGHELPVLEATPATLEDALRGLAAESNLTRRRTAGRAFVTAIHDGRMSARVLRDHWISRPDDGDGVGHASRD